MSDDGLNLRQAAERLIYWCGRIERATTEAEENECCNERDKLFAVFRKVDSERANKPEGLIAGGEQVRAPASHNTPPAEEDRGEPLPCPFCAEPAAVRVQRHRNKPLLHAVFCTGPDCHTTTPAYTTRERAISRWNRRLSSPRVEGETRRKALEEAAKVAERGCLVPPDGGSPTDAEREMGESIAKAIRSLSPQGE